jgi:hypothetical protein
VGNVTFTMPEGQGLKRLFVVVDGQASNSVPFAYAPPRVSAMSPSVIPVAGYPETWRVSEPGAPHAVLTGSSFGSPCPTNGSINLECGQDIWVYIHFPAHNITVDQSDTVCARACSCAPVVQCSGAGQL